MPGPLVPGSQRRATGEIETPAAPTTLVDVLVMVGRHHGNWDGSRYPVRLAWDASRIGSPILAIVDCGDALTSERPCRRVPLHADGIEMIKERGGSMDDPFIVDVFPGALATAAQRAAEHDWPAALPDCRPHETTPLAIANPLETRA